MEQQPQDMCLLCSLLIKSAQAHGCVEIKDCKFVQVSVLIISLSFNVGSSASLSMLDLQTSEPLFNENAQLLAGINWAQYWYKTINKHKAYLQKIQKHVEAARTCTTDKRESSNKLPACGGYNRKCAEWTHSSGK